MDKTESRVCLAVEPSPVEGEWSFYVEADKDTVPIVRMTKREFRGLVKRLSKRREDLKLDHDMGKSVRRQLLRLGKGKKAVTLSLNPGEFRLVVDYLARRYEAGPHVCVDGKVLKPK